MEQRKTSLVISLHNVEFSQDYHYFITLDLDSDKEKVGTRRQLCLL